MAPLLISMLGVLAHTASATPSWTAPRRAGGHCMSPVFEPGAERLAYALNFHEDRRVETWIAPLAGGEPELVSVGPGGAGAPAAFGSATRSLVHGLTWAPGNALAFKGHFVVSATGPGGEIDLYSSQVREPLASARGHDGDAAWNPVDESLLVFSSARTGEGDLYLVDFSQPGEPVRLSAIQGSSEVDAAWSPDGSSVAFVAHTEAGDNVWIMDSVRAKSEPRRLTADTATQVRPTWAPAGPPRLAFYQYAPGSGAELDRVDLMVATPQGGVRKLVEGIVPDEQGPAWTPDGLQLVVVLDDSEAFDPIARVDARSGALTRLSTGTVGNRDLAIGYTRTGEVLLAVCAQGDAGGAQRDFRRAMVIPLAL